VVEPAEITDADADVDRLDHRVVAQPPPGDGVKTGTGCQKRTIHPIFGDMDANRPVLRTGSTDAPPTELNHQGSTDELDQPGSPNCDLSRVFGGKHPA